jgi:hypothetical protein
MTTRINADTNGLTETVDTSGILEIQTNGATAVIIGVDQNANFTSTGAITVPAGTTAQRPTPVNGMMRYNSNVAVFEVYANNVWAAANVTPAPTNTVAPVISGSAVVGQNLTCTTGTWSGSPSAYFYQWRANSTAISNATANVFTLTSTQTGANITCNVTAFNVAGNSSPATSNTLGPVVLGTTVNYLIVAGGGGGGGSMGGGGGAGGFQTGTTILQPANTYAITIGAGGAGSAIASGAQGVNGSNSSIAGLTASIGGGGAGYQNANGRSGGSGGGAGSASGVTAGAGTSGQGFAGGLGAGLDSGSRGGGGGGGSSAVGGVGTSTTGGNGGAGTASSITGSSVTYAGGGGAGCGRSTGTPGTGGAGGGGSGTNDGSNATNGTANLGGGGGGAGESSSFVNGTPGAGGSGVVIISYPGAQQFGGGVITSAGGNTIHTFYTSGSIVPLTSLSASYLAVAGGGGSASSSNGGGFASGGGGGGGVLAGSNVTIDSSSTYVITVGAGGVGPASGTNTAGGNGANSTFSAIANVAVGGGGAGPYNGISRNGGSGGGESQGSGSTAAGSGTSGQGNNGGSKGSAAAAGGGGAGAVGVNGSGTTGGNGGIGIASSISGTSTYYAGGGGGGSANNGTKGTGGLGGGGNGETGDGNGTPGIANTGGGAGGFGSSYSLTATGQNGGSGIVIVAYPGSTPQMAGGNVTVVSNTVVHTFTSSGYLTPFVLSTNSLRFRSSANAYLSRTYGTPTNSKIWTFSAWIKRGKLDAGSTILNGNSSGSQFYFQSNNTLVFYDGTSGADYITTQVFRDPAAWYHIVVAMDTTQATAGNRTKIYVNGSQVTAFSTATTATQNNNSAFNVASTLFILGVYYPAPNNYFDGYFSETRFVDGQALTPNSFGTFNQYGVWQPVAYAGSYGTNGFYLPFTNTANTTALGYDFSPQGNNWTPTNISLTAGSTYDSMTDVPTLTSANVANYAVLNPLFDASVSNSNGNLQTVIGTGSISTVPATMGFTSGKYYCEVTYVATGANGLTVGVTQSNLSTANQYNWAAGGVGYRSSNGYSNTNGAGQVAYGATWTTGDVIGIAVDTTANTITFYKNGTSQGALTLPTLATGASWLFSFSNITSGGTQTMAANFGQQPWAYTPPTSHVGVNTYNL